MYGPERGIEYRDGSTECSEFHVPLATGTRMPEPQGPSDPRSRFGSGAGGKRSHPVLRWRGLLDDAGIPLFVSGKIATLVQSLGPLVRKQVGLQVPRNREGEARELLQQLLQPVGQDSTDLGA
jgi:hypothetical protein